MYNNSPYISPDSNGLVHIARNKCYVISYSEAKNRIYFSILGFWKNHKSVPEFLNDWDKALQMASPEFTMLVDMRTMITHPQHLYGLHEEALQKVRTARVIRVANVMPHDKIASLQAAEIIKSVELPTENFETCQAAERWLDHPIG